MWLQINAHLDSASRLRKWFLQNYFVNRPIEGGSNKSPVFTSSRTMRVRFTYEKLVKNIIDESLEILERRKQV
ncbi:hypothetical protein FF38_07493 [Lucilia cuprina]|uniref:Uncharacterized protein n=1 Tax=Lucilia cuprina TaxID=7375 RepID=A0A0L0CQJ1_LUCCU|nr:hypothetical protein FF38_07493 [Lucilia cuprina]